MAAPTYWLKKNLTVYEAILEYNGQGNKESIVVTDIIEYLLNLNQEGGLGEKTYSRRELLEIISDMRYYGLFTLAKKDGVEKIYLKGDFYKAKSALAIKKKKQQALETNAEENAGPEDSDAVIDTGNIDITSISNLNYYIKKIKKYNGPDKNLVSHLPDLLNLSMDIMNDPRTDWESRLFISSALGYFFIEDDVIPYGKPFCYLDDLFLVVYVLELVKIRNQPLLISHWDKPENFEELLDSLYNHTREGLGNNVFKILSFVGLAKYFRENKELQARRDRSSSYSLNRERSELLGMIAYMMNQIYGVSSKRRTQEYLMEKLKQMGEEDEILRMIAIAKGELVPAAKRSDEELLKADLQLLEETLMLQEDDYL